MKTSMKWVRKVRTECGKNSKNSLFFYKLVRSTQLKTPEQHSKHMTEPIMVWVKDEPVMTVVSVRCLTETHTVTCMTWERSEDPCARCLLFENSKFSSQSLQKGNGQNTIKHESQTQQANCKKLKTNQGSKHIKDNDYIQGS